MTAAKPQALKDAFLVPIEQIVPSPLNPRKVIDQNDLLELALSIKEHGVLEPLIVRKVGDGYELVAGERRYRASQIVKLDKVPVRIVEMEDGAAAEVRLIENLQRKDLAPVEEARAVRELMERYQLTQQQAAVRIGKSEPWVRSRLRLMEVPEVIQQLVAEGKLTMGSLDLLAPLAKYPVSRAIYGRIAERIEQRGSIPSSEIEPLMWNTLSSQYHQQEYLDEGQDEEDCLAVDISDYSLENLPGPDISHLNGHFDFQPCRECRDVMRNLDEETKEEDTAICMRPDCFYKKLQEANDKFRQFQIAEAERLGATPSDPGQKMLGVDYDFEILWNEFPECASCADRTRGKERRDNKCLNPSCMKEKEKARKAADLKEAKDRWGKFMDALNRKTLPRLGGTFLSLTPAMKRRLLLILESYWQTKEAFDRSVKIFSVDRKTMNNLAEEDLELLLTRIMIYEMAREKAKGAIPSPDNIEEALRPDPKDEPFRPCEEECKLCCLWEGGKCSEDAKSEAECQELYAERGEDQQEAEADG